YAHSHRIIHRDLKPSNVIVGEFGETVVIDWGLAKDLTESQASAEPGDGAYRSTGWEACDLTSDGSVLGTPKYMPPEQARGETADERADVYALGAILYHVLSGKAPFDEIPSARLMALLGDSDPRGIELVEPRVPEDLAAVVRKGMARRPDARYPTAQAMVED